MQNRKSNIRWVKLGDKVIAFVFVEYESDYIY